MTECSNGDMRDLLPDLLHGRLAPDARQSVEAHVQACADCREELALLRTMSATLRSGPSVNVAALVANIPAYRSPARQGWGGWRAAAAILVLAVGGTSVAVMQRDAAVTPAPRELAIGGAAIGDLDDRELLALLENLGTVEMLPSADVENGVAAVVAAGTQ